MRMKDKTLNSKGCVRTLTRHAHLIWLKINRKLQTFHIIWFFFLIATDKVGNQHHLFGFLGFFFNVMLRKDRVAGQWRDQARKTCFRPLLQVFPRSALEGVPSFQAGAGFTSIHKNCAHWHRSVNTLAEAAALRQRPPVWGAFIISSGTFLGKPPQYAGTPRQKAPFLCCHKCRKIFFFFHWSLRRTKLCPDALHPVMWLFVTSVGKLYDRWAEMPPHTKCILWYVETISLKWAVPLLYFHFRY